MAVPKQKKSRRRTRQGRSHHSLNAPTLVSCKKCGEKVRPHMACATCGYYGDKKVVDVETKLDKKLKKKENKKEEKD
jgi:large subunit ribosomal protein L32